MGDIPSSPNELSLRIPRSQSTGCYRADASKALRELLLMFCTWLMASKIGPSGEHDFSDMQPAQECWFRCHDKMLSEFVLSFK